jgi:hypothetical protein
MLRTYICIFIYKYIYAYTHYPFRYLGRVLSRIPQKETLCRQLVLRHMLNRYSAWIWSQCNTHVCIYMCIRIHTSLHCVFINTLHYTVYLFTHYTITHVYSCVKVIVRRSHLYLSSAFGADYPYLMLARHIFSCLCSAGQFCKDGLTQKSRAPDSPSTHTYPPHSAGVDWAQCNARNDTAFWDHDVRSHAIRCVYVCMCVCVYSCGMRHVL